MELFALLAACTCIGLSSGEYFDVHYGGSHTFRVPIHAEYLYFQAVLDSDANSVLWRRSKPFETTRGEFHNRDFTIDKLTQADNGIYTFKTRDNRSFGGNMITVSHHEETYNQMVGEELHFDFSLDPKMCMLTFTSSRGVKLDIFRNGYVLDDYFGPRLNLHQSVMPIFSVDIEDLQVEDSGVYEIRDLHNNVAMQVNVEVEEPAQVGKKVGLAASVVAVVVSCCCCMKRCCCKRSSKSSDPDPQPAESPANLQQYSTEPSPPRYSVEPRPPVNPGYSYQPANPAASVEIYSPVSVPFTAPPVQAPAAGGQAAAPEVLNSSIMSSDTDPHFEMKGMNLAPPLYSECTSADVYTSDKLNFNFL